jgi:hypothetical protein
MKRTAAEMYPLVESYLASDLTQEHYCQQEGFSIAVLNYWLKKYRNEHGGPSFIEIEPTPAGCIELTYPNGIRLSFDRLVPAAYLRELVAHR